MLSIDVSVASCSLSCIWRKRSMAKSALWTPQYIYIYNRGSRKRGWNIALVACTLHSLSRIHFPANLGPVYLLVINATALNLIGLHLFKDDTCHTEHTSRPTQVYAGVFHSCHNLWTRQYTRLYCPVVWTSSSSKLHQLWTDSNEELHGIFDRLYQIEESGFS